MGKGDLTDDERWLLERMGLWDVRVDPPTVAANHDSLTEFEAKRLLNSLSDRDFVDKLDRELFKLTERGRNRVFRSPPAKNGLADVS